MHVTSVWGIEEAGPRNAQDRNAEASECAMSVPRQTSGLKGKQDHTMTRAQLTTSNLLQRPDTPNQSWVIEQIVKRKGIKNLNKIGMRQGGTGIKKIDPRRDYTKHRPAREADFIYI